MPSSTARCDTGPSAFPALTPSRTLIPAGNIPTTKRNLWRYIQAPQPICKFSRSSLRANPRFYILNWPKIFFLSQIHNGKPNLVTTVSFIRTFAAYKYIPHYLQLHLCNFMADPTGTRHYNCSSSGAKQGVSNIGGIYAVDADSGVSRGAA